MKEVLKLSACAEVVSPAASYAKGATSEDDATAFTKEMSQVAAVEFTSVILAVRDGHDGPTCSALAEIANLYLGGAVFVNLSINF